VAKRRRAVIATAISVVGLWCAVLLIPVNWPLSAYQNENAVFPLGPVSAVVQPGQMFSATEPFDVLAAPVRIGGPFGSAVTLHTRIRLDGPGGATVVESSPAEAESTHGAYQMVLFRLPKTIAARDGYFLEFDIPRGTSWPIFLAAIGGDKEPDGRLFMAGSPSHEGQDLAYQLLRRQSVGERLPTWWGANRGSVVVGVGLVLLVHLISFTATRALRLESLRRLPDGLVLGLAPPALLAATYFALLFLVL